MAFKLADRVRETSITTGTGTFTLAGAVSGFRRFTDVLATGDTTFYTVVLGADFESGVGTFTAPDQLARTSIFESSNGGAAVNFGSGVKNVFITLPAKAALTRGTGADLRGLTDDNRALTAKAHADAIATVALGMGSGTLTLALTAGMNQSAIAVGNLTLGQHTGIFDGEPVTLEIVQDATGGRTLAVNTTYNKFPGGTVPTLTTAANARDILYGTARVIGGVGQVHWTGIAKDIK